MAKSAYLNGEGSTVTVNTTGGGDNVGSGGSGGSGGPSGGGSTPSNVKPFFKLSQLETSDVNGADVFNVNHDGGRIFFIQPHLSVDSTKYPDSDWIKPEEWASPFTVKDNKEIEIHFPYTIVERVGTGQDLIVPEEMKNLNFSMSFEPIEDEETQVTSSIYQGSYADITVGNLRTYSGDVHRTKIYAKRQGHTANGFFKIADFVLQPDNQLIDSASLSGKLPIGLFYTQSIVDNNWQTSSATVATLRDTYLVGGVSLSGSNENVGDSYTFETKNNMVFTKGEDYQVLFDLQYFKADKSGSYTAENDAIITVEPHAEIEVYLSGSIESSNADVEYSLGTFSSDETSPDFSDVLSSTSGSIRRVYNIFRTHNITNQISSGSLGFRIKSGRFDLSAISITPFVDQNFNPGFTNVSVPMPVNDEAEVRYDFLAEFYDFNNNKSLQLAQTSASVLFEGPRKVISITGDDIWDGTATIGRSMKLHGSNPAFLSTIGYNGFAKTRDHSSNRERDGGVLLFSGSIGNGATENFLSASEAYEGVGLEILDASSSSSFEHRFLKFRTNPSEFTVQTNQFLLGVSGSGGDESFISSSGNILEISSSNFHLSASGNLNVGNSAMVVTPAGDLTLQGSITATAGGQIGGFTITDKAISTTDFFLSGSAHSGTGFQKTNLVLSSSGFQINSDGEISASEGAIGGFGIGASSLSATGFFISGSSTGTGFADTNLFISSSGFQVNAVGAISASSGVIGGFALTGNAISSSNNNLVLSSSGQITGSNVKFDGGTIGGFELGSTVISSSNNNLVLSSSGQITGSNVKFDGGVIGGFELGSTVISSSNDNLVLSSSGQITGSNVLFDGGVIGGFVLTDSAISSSNNKLKLFDSGIISGSDVHFTGGKIANFTIDGHSLTTTGVEINDSTQDLFISSSKFKVKHDGTITGSLVQFTGGTIGGFQISGDSISSTNIFISGSPQAGGVHDTRYMFISTSKFNVKEDGDITGSAVLFEGGKVGGFTIDTDSIEGGNLVLHSAGRVESADFSSGVMAGTGQGFRLSAEGNGFLEVENARIRGTLSTAVFEKETVNAVGGIMMIGNSTVITGSGGFSGVTASSATMSVENVSGFTGSYNGFNSSGDVTNLAQIDGEILMIKKFDNTGFSTEYVCVQSASFNADSTAQNNGTDLSGKLYVTRSFSGTTVLDKDGAGSNQSKTGTSGFTGSYVPGGNAQNYEDGQVIVSTGKYFSGTAAGGNISGSGFIMMNAKSTDQFTPYIDIIERTGSQVYSMELKARLGDLSGLSSALVGSDPGFGLFSENVFLTGKITATSGEIAGWGLVGNKITSSNGSVELDSTGPGRISLGGTPPTAPTGDGAFLSGSGEFYVGKNNGERIHFNPTGNGLIVSSSNLSLDVGGLVIQGTDSSDPTNNKILVGSATSLNGGGDGIFMDGDGHFRAGTNTGHRIEFNKTAGTLILSSSTFFLGSKGSNNSYISSSGNNLEISGSNFALTNGNITASNVDLSGKITATSGEIGGFSITSTAVSSSNNKLKLFDSGIISGSDVHFTGGKIGGFTLDNHSLTTTGVEINDSTQDMFISSSVFKLDHAGNVTASNVDLSGKITISSGDLAGVTAASISGSQNASSSIHAASASQAAATGSSLASKVVITGDSVKVQHNANNFAELSGSGMSIHENGDKIAQFSSTTRIGKSNDNRLEITDTTFKLFEGASNERIVIDGNGVQIKEDTNNFTEVSASGMSVFAGGDRVGQFAQDTIIGKTSAAHLDIKTSGGAGTNGITFTNSSGTDIVFMGNAAEVESFTQGGGACLLFGSQVSKSDGTIINVEDLEVGDELLSITLPNATDENVGDWKQDTFNVSSSFNQQTTTIENILHLTSDHYYNINDSSELITGTHYMLYRVSNIDEWVWEVAPNFEIGNFLMDKNGDEVEITSINRIEGDCNVVSIDTETDDFYVASTFMVHNKGILASGYSVDGIVTNNLVADALHITGSGDITGSLYAGGLYVSSSTGLGTAGGNTVMINVNDGTNEVFQVTSEGEVLAKDNISAFASITSLSDKRLKEDIYTLSGSMNKILQLRPTEFTWKENKKQDIGFIAQEVEEIIPEVIHETKGLIDLNSKEQDNTTYKTISYEKLTVYLVDTIKELTKRIEELEKKDK